MPEVKLGISKPELIRMNIRNINKLRDVDVAFTRLQRTASLLIDAKQYATPGMSLVPNELLADLAEAVKPIAIQQ